MIPRLLQPAFKALTHGFMPMYWVQLAFAAGSLALGAYGASQSGKAGEAAAKAQQEAFAAEQELKKQAVQAQTESLLAAKDQAYHKAVSTMSEQTRQAMMQRGRMRAAAGEAGIAGGPVTSIIMTSYFEEAKARGEEIYNLDKYNEQVHRDIRGVQTGLMLGKGPSDYDSTGDWLGFASQALSIGSSYAAGAPAASGGSGWIY